ncbi:hypothetical protein GCM10010170_080710 [Dactylosporangium salmoneum]|uniref:Uncharacterized protein n=1 Tax=Dactylosporangium salmoneum TaxID=53361 RepID=A0ABP5UCH2_9ACTN
MAAESDTARIDENPPDAGRQRRRTAVGHEQAGAVGEQFDGVREGRRDDGNASGYRRGEDTGGDLSGGVVRQHDDVGGADQAPQSGFVVVHRQVVHDLGGSQQRPELLQAGPVSLTVALADFRMGSGRRRCRLQPVGDPAGEPPPVAPTRCLYPDRATPR